MPAQSEYKPVVRSPSPGLTRCAWKLKRPYSALFASGSWRHSQNRKRRYSGAAAGEPQTGRRFRGDDSERGKNPPAIPGEGSLPSTPGRVPPGQEALHLPAQGRRASLPMRAPAGNSEINFRKKVPRKKVPNVWQAADLDSSRELTRLCIFEISAGGGVVKRPVLG